MYMNDERFEKVVYSTYGNEDAIVIKGVYETVNDNWLLVERNIFERLLRKENVTFGVLLSEAKEQLRDEIIAEYLEKQAEESVQRRTSRLLALNKQRIKEANVRKLQIIALIIQGFSKCEVQYNLNICKTTVNKALQNLNPLDVVQMYNIYKDSYFEDVDPKQVSEFVKTDCSYKAYRRWLKRQV